VPLLCQSSSLAYSHQPCPLAAVFAQHKGPDPQTIDMYPGCRRTTPGTAAAAHLVRKKLAPSLSILFTKQMRGTLYLSAWRHTVSDWGSTPDTASNTATAPSSTRSARSTCLGLAIVKQQQQQRARCHDMLISCCVCHCGCCYHRHDAQLLHTAGCITRVQAPACRTPQVCAPPTASHYSMTHSQICIQLQRIEQMFLARKANAG
jgi:hypothetical protein